MLLVKDLARIGRDYRLTQEYLDFLVKHKVHLLCMTGQIELPDQRLFQFIARF